VLCQLHCCPGLLPSRTRQRVYEQRLGLVVVSRFHVEQREIVRGCDGISGIRPQDFPQDVEQTQRGLDRFGIPSGFGEAGHLPLQYPASLASLTTV